MNPHIFVIEDVPEMAELVSMYLKKNQMDVTVCTTAEEALEKLSSAVPDLVLLDLNLPGMSGFEFLKKFRKAENATIPVIHAAFK